MNPISNTAFYCCGIRMLDARSPRPVCGDIYAERFMDERGLEILRKFGAELAPNISNVARHRYIDDELRRRLAANPQLRVILLGSGFDSRAFRLAGGEWVELDEPPLIAYKNEKLPPDTCPNPLVRIPIRFDADSLEKKLSGYATNRDTVVVIEGVTMYVPAEAMERTLRTLRKLLPRHDVLTDLMTRRFAETFGRSIRQIIAAMGANLDPLDDPAGPFVRASYRQRHSESIIGLAMKYRGLGLLRPLLRLFMPRGASGYTVRTFS